MLAPRYNAMIARGVNVVGEAEREAGVKSTRVIHNCRHVRVEFMVAARCASCVRLVLSAPPPRSYTRASSTMAGVVSTVTVANGSEVATPAKSCSDRKADLFGRGVIDRVALALSVDHVGGAHILVAMSKSESILAQVCARGTAHQAQRAARQHPSHSRLINGSGRAPEQIRGNLIVSVQAPYTSALQCLPLDYQLQSQHGGTVDTE
jgi:hypothetical protein